ncbi:MAG: Rieske 2Fe-2S domain-containing protein [Chitinophagales bacterium]|nr:Rieske 2Fe-2S domain-containing protein [Chitinophagales bacterium]
MTKDLRYQWETLPEEDTNKILQLENQQHTLIEWKGRKICVTRLDDKFYGLNDRCPHAGTPFTIGGTCNKRGIMVCETHHYKFDIKTGLSADGNSYKIPHYTFYREDGKLLIGKKGG